MIMLSISLPEVRSEEVVPQGYRSIAAERGIPYAIFYALALTESGKKIPDVKSFRPWPWTLNVEGRGYFFESRLAAWQTLKGLLDNGNRSIDIGLMQVNWRYHSKRLISAWQALDPHHNLRVGAEILQDCFLAERDWWVGVGCYHSPNNSERAAQYRRRVLSRWQRLVKTG